jgi:hypothetical protein
MERIITKGSVVETFVAGNLLVIGTWYIHRPFLLDTFPQIASDVDSTGIAGIGGKFLFLTLASTVMGIYITHIFDAIVPIMVGGPLYANKRQKYIKMIIIWFFKIFTFSFEKDPRIVSTRRYLTSIRKDWFLEVVRDWARSSEAEMKDESEIVKVHQHITTRLRVLSDASRRSIQDAYSDVVFAGSIFVSFILLIPVSLLALYTNKTVSSAIKTIPSVQIYYITLIIYIAALVSSFFFRRRLRTFYNQILTLALHYYDIEASKKMKLEASAPKHSLDTNPELPDALTRPLLG